MLRPSRTSDSDPNHAPEILLLPLTPRRDWSAGKLTLKPTNSRVTATVVSNCDFPTRATRNAAPEGPYVSTLAGLQAPHLTLAVPTPCTPLPIKSARKLSKKQGQRFSVCDHRAQIGY